MAGEFQAGLRGTLEALDRMQKLSEARAESPAKRKEYKARELKAEREIDLAPKLDIEATTKVDTSIATILKQGDEATLTRVGSHIASIKDESSYKEALRNLTEKDKEDFNITGKGYKKEKKNLDYITDRYVHTQKQIQALELEGTKAASKGFKYKAENLGRVPTEQELGAIQTQMYADKAFSSMSKDDFVQSSNMLAMTYKDLQTKANAQNEQLAAAGKPPIQFDNAKAFALAKKQTMEYLYQGLDTDWYTFGFGDPEPKYMTPEQANERYNEWRRIKIQQLAQADPNFVNQLQTDPYAVDSQIRAIYQKEQAMRMLQDEMKLKSRINTR